MPFEAYEHCHCEARSNLYDWWEDFKYFRINPKYRFVPRNDSIYKQ